jgi:DNA-binding LacI/PurR family transcriptional regulator
MTKTTITMADIAREAGVSRATASYVINGQETSVHISANTRQRVLDAAQALGYRRNALARAMVTGKNRVLGVLARNPGPEPKARIVEGILEEAGTHDYFIKLLHHPREEDAREVARRCVEQRLAGVIVIRPSQIALAEFYAELKPYRIPIVLVDDSVEQEGVIRVATDDFQGCRLAVEHLVTLGHRRIALLEGRRDANPLLRETAFRMAMSDYGLSVPDSHVVYGDWSPEQTEQIAHDLFHPRPDCPTALLCSAGDPFAAVVMRALRQDGQRVPEDVSIVGYSDLLMAACLDPPLTTIAQPFDEMGRSAVRRLLTLLDDGQEGHADEPRDYLLPTELIVRASTGPAPTA